MKRIRIGKDIEIHWPILTNGQQVALEGRDLKLFVHLPSHMDIPVDFTTEGNTAIFTISGAMQKSIGVYRLTMWENLQKRGQTAVDYCKAFELVPTTLLEGGEDESNLTTETVNLEASSLVIGLPGESAYEAFKKYNPNSELTEEEYAEAPVDAANAANEAAKAANDAVNKVGNIDKLLAEKVDKEEGKGLSTNDYTDQEKEKLAGLSNYDDTEIRKELSDKVSKKELTEAAAGTLTEAKSYTDTKATELWNNVGDTFDAMSEELNSNLSGGDAQTLTEAKNYTDKAISEIPTPDVSGQIERHNTSPTAHPDIRELLNTCVGLPEFNDKTYELTFTTKGGAKFIIDLPIEMMGLHYNEDTQSIEFVNADGSISSIPVSDFVKVYVGSIGSEIQVTVEGSEIRASLLNNTVSWDKLTLALQEMIQGKADRTELSTKLSQLQNDPNFVTSGTLETQLTPIKTELGGTVRLGEEIGESSTPPPIPDTDDEITEVLAHSDCTLEERVTHLERLLMEMLSGKVLIPELQVKKLGVWGDNNLVVTGEGAPSKAPDRAGQFYVDTKNNAVYHSVGNGAVSDWKNA